MDEKIQAEEQEFLLRAIKALDEEFERVGRQDPSQGVDKASQGQILKHKETALKQLREVGDGIILGRILIDTPEGLEDFHVGKIRLPVDDRLIISWQTEMAQAFYQPSAAKAGKLLERRTITVRNRDVARVEVENYDSSTSRESGGVIESRKLPDPSSKTKGVERPERTPSVVKRLRAEETILDELGRSRDSRMREVVATIQEDQDRAIRAASDVALFIEGGPGSGKTVVGLHRLAVILYNQAMAGVARDALVVGPNRRFMDYVSQVLPSLGENAVEMADVRSICLSRLPQALVSKIGYAESTDAFAERVKGDALMVELLREAAWTAPPPFAFTVTREGGRARFEETEIKDLLESIKSRVFAGSISITDARRTLGQRLIELAAPRFRQSKDVAVAAQAQRMDRRETEATARQAPNKNKVGDGGDGTRDARDTEFVSRPLTRSEDSEQPIEEIALRANDTQMLRVVDRLLPLLDAEKVVRRVFEGAVKGSQSGDVSGALLRKYIFGVKKFDLQALTDADVALLATAEQILDNPTMKVGHVVVDEAQDISPVVWSLIRARVERNSVTVLGDLNQRTSPGACQNWEEAAGALGLAEWNQMTLELSYRVPKPILEFAKRALPEGSRVLAPLGLRDGEEPTVVNIGHTPDLADIDNVLRISEKGDLIGVVTTNPVLLETVRDRTVFVKPHEAKGLEFDTVVVVEPEAWFKGTDLEGTDEARRLLFIALSRPTKHLAVLHYLPLPPELR